MAFVQFTNVSIAFADRDILKDAALFLSSGSKAALAGPNGVGKTTLLKVITGLIKADYGDRAVQKDTRLSYLPQNGVVFSELSVYNEAEKAFDSILNLLHERDEIASKLENTTENNSKLDSMLESYHIIDETINNSGYWNRKDKIISVLTGLGFNADDIDRPANELSGGWQMRLALAKVLLESPDIMLLDEPTNYLDIEARTWLENYLIKFTGGFMIVSHDRSFLDATIKEVYELYNAKLSRYPGSYTAYEKKREVERNTLLKAWQIQQAEIAQLEDFIRRFRYNATKASQVQSRVKQLEKIDIIQIPENMKRIHFSFPPAPHSGKIALTIENLRKAYDKKQVIETLNLSVEAGSKIALVGKNGAGKSTLLRLIAGIDSEYQGNIVLGSGIVTAYFSQDVADSLNNTKTVVDEASTVCPTELIPSLRNMLGAFLFRGDDVEKPVSVLSGGERARLALLKMLLHPANLIILDEPTNHLDLASKDILLEALQKFNGTVLFVSHDKFFIDGLADKILELSCGTAPKLYYGNYTYYLSKTTEIDTGADTEPVKIKQAEAPAINRLSRDEAKKNKAELSKQKKRESEIMARLESIEHESKTIIEAMAKQENYSDGLKIKALQEKLAQLENESSALSSEWESMLG